MNILFVTSEAYPLIKTGGLADVAASLPRALLKRGHSARLVLPAYPRVLEAARKVGLKPLASLTYGERNITVWQTRLPGTRVTVWLVDMPEFSNRGGNPYVDDQGLDWPDNHRRFYWFGVVAAELAMGRAGVDWRADLVHGNDWQSGMAMALLAQEPKRPALVFTIHNLAYHGLFPYSAFAELSLPEHWWHPEAMEFYNQLSFIKGGLVFADQITTVSPSYAREIQTPEFGCGLDGLLFARQAQLSGILNGIDTQEWNPGRDPHLTQNYSRRNLKHKVVNKLALQERVGLPPSEETPLLGFIGRLVEQKGVDLMLAALPEFLKRGECQFVILGSGQAQYHTALKELQALYPEQLALTLGYDESLAHQIEGGVDLFLMPSLFEPCGLNQLYSLRYGTLPLVHAVGGLNDTVFESSDQTEDVTAAESTPDNGFRFEAPTASALRDALTRALALYHQPDRWRQRQLNAMKGDYSWEKSAQEYERVYEQALQVRDQH